MIEQMSPLTRRIVALGLLVLTVLLVVEYVLVPLGNAIVDQRDELAALRDRATRLRATIDRPLPAPSRAQADQAITAASEALATQRLQALLAGQAAVTGVTLQLRSACPVQPDSSVSCTDIAVSGTEAKFAHFLSVVEHGAPAIRFRSWRLSAPQAGDAQLHFTGRAIAAWRRAL